LVKGVAYEVLEAEALVALVLGLDEGVSSSPNDL